MSGYITLPTTFQTYLSRKLSLLKIYEMLEYLLNQHLPNKKDLISNMKTLSHNENRKKDIIELLSHLKEHQNEIKEERNEEQTNNTKRKISTNKEAINKTHFHFLHSLLTDYKHKFEAALINNNIRFGDLDTPTENLAINLDCLVQLILKQRTNENLFMFSRFFMRVFDGSLQAKSRFLEIIDSYIFLLSATKDKAFYNHITSMRHGRYNLLDVFRSNRDSFEEKILNYEIHIVKSSNNEKPERLLVPDLFPLYAFVTFLTSESFCKVNNIPSEIPDVLVMALCHGYKLHIPSENREFYERYSKDLKQQMESLIVFPDSQEKDNSGYSKMFDIVSHLHSPLNFFKMFKAFASIIKEARSKQIEIGLMRSKDENFSMLKNVAAECEKNDLIIQQSTDHPHYGVLTSTVVDNANQFKQKGVSYRFLVVEGIGSDTKKELRYSVIKENNVVWISVYFSIFSEFAEKLVKKIVFTPINNKGKLYVFDKNFYDEIAVRMIRDINENQKVNSLIEILTHSSKFTKKSFVFIGQSGDEKIKQLIKKKHTENYLLSENHKSILDPETINEMLELVQFAIFKVLVIETNYLLEIEDFSSACDQSFFSCVKHLRDFENEKIKENQDIFSSLTCSLFTDIVCNYAFQLEMFSLFQSSRDQVEISSVLGKEKTVRKDQSTKILSAQKKAHTFSLIPACGFFLEKESGTVFSENILKNFLQNGMIHQAELLKKFENNVSVGDKISILIFDKTPYTTEYTFESVPVSKPFDHKSEIEEINEMRQQIFSSFYLSENQLEVNGILLDKPLLEEEKSEMKDCFFRAMKSSPKISNEHTSLYSIGVNFTLGDIKNSLEKINIQYYSGNLKETRDYIVLECDPNIALKDTELEQTFITSVRQTVPIYKSNQEKINEWLKFPKESSKKSQTNTELKERIRKINNTKRMDIHSMPYIVSPSCKNQVVLLFIKQDILLNIQSSVIPCMWEKSLISNQIFNNENDKKLDKEENPLFKKQKTQTEGTISENLKIKTLRANLPNTFSSKSYQIGKFSNKGKSITYLLKNSVIPSLCNNFCSQDVFRSQMSIKTLASMFSPKLTDRINNQVCTRSAHLKAFSFIYHVSSNADSYTTDFCPNSSFVTSFSFDSVEKRKYDENFFDLSEIHSEEIENMLVDSNSISGGLLVRYKQLLLLEITKILSETTEEEDISHHDDIAKQIFQLVSGQYKHIKVERGSSIIPNQLYSYEIYFKSGTDKQKAFEKCKESFTFTTDDIEQTEKESMFDTIEKIFKEGVVLSVDAINAKNDPDSIIKNSSLFFLSDYLGSKYSSEEILNCLGIDVPKTFARFTKVIKLSPSPKKYLVKEDVQKESSFFGDLLSIALKTECPLVILDEDVKDFWEILMESSITFMEKSIVEKILFPKNPPLKQEENSGNYTDYCNFISNKYLYAAINQGCSHNTNEKANYTITNKNKDPFEVFKNFTTNLSNDLLSEMKAMCPICISKFPSKYRESRKSPPSGCINLNYDLFYKMNKSVVVKRTNQPVSFSELFTTKEFSIPSVYLPLILNFEPIFSDDRNSGVDVQKDTIEIDMNAIKISCKIFLLSLVVFSKEIPNASKKKLLSYIKFLKDLPQNFGDKSETVIKKSLFHNERTKMIVLPNTTNPSSKTIDIDELSFIHQHCSSIMFPCYNGAFHANDKYKIYLTKKIIKNECTKYFLSEKAIIRGYNLKKHYDNVGLENKELSFYEQQNTSLTKNELIQLVDRHNIINLMKTYQNEDSKAEKIKLFQYNCDSITKGSKDLCSITDHLLNILNGKNSSVYLKIITSLFYSLEYTKGNILDATKKKFLLTPLRELIDESKKEFTIDSPFQFCQIENLNFLVEDDFMNNLIAQSKTKEIDFPLSIKVKTKRVLSEYTTNMFDAMNFSDLFPILDEYSFCGTPLVTKNSTACLYYFRQGINFSLDNDEMVNVVKVKGNTNKNFYDLNPKKKKFRVTNNLTHVSDEMFDYGKNNNSTKSSSDKKQTFSYYTKLFQNRIFLSLLGENLGVKLAFIVK